ncbi:hypothetical protein JCM19301_3985 [Jejuia pallidilutea]|uniref:Uncharacterized protein n=1 Tax=Jejuia pallidilutea TaxID=504487 RepID=A0A090VLA4_9FLAO|nr:hypothetical protein JCM19301_3985 [Jejuia pallidilutea]GAL88932.1 hypothetical protein JCM19538_1921 [Jejuia pallidilutea]
MLIVNKSKLLNVINKDKYIKKMKITFIHGYFRMILDNILFK